MGVGDGRGNDFPSRCSPHVSHSGPTQKWSTCGKARIRTHAVLHYQSTTCLKLIKKKHEFSRTYTKLRKTHNDFVQKYESWLKLINFITSATELSCVRVLVSAVMMWGNEYIITRIFTLSMHDYASYIFLGDYFKYKFKRLWLCEVRSWNMANILLDIIILCQLFYCLCGSFANRQKGVKLSR